mgnify:FL=1
MSTGGRTTDLNYRSKTVINQRGATVEINNSSDREELKLSQFSGSNVTLNNSVNSELATNNKQVKVQNDSFESVGKDKNTVVGKDQVNRVYENTYDFRGFINDTEIESLSAWKKEMAESGIPGINSQFPILRGGYGYLPVQESVTEIKGERTYNSTKNQNKFVVNNPFTAYCPAPIRSADTDEVMAYEPVEEPRYPPGPAGRSPDDIDIETGSGEVGSNAPGVIEFGTTLNAATEGGTWEKNELRDELPDKLKEIQEEKLNEIEQAIGNGGDIISFVKRNKFETVGGAVNEFPSIRIDPRGRSQPVEVAVGEKTTYTNMDYVPLVEDVNSDVNFPGGDYTLNVGNKYSVIVGAGGVQMKTTGAVEIGGTSMKIAASKLNVMASQGMHLTSENLVELQSTKSISLRSGRQIYIEPGVGVKGNLVVGGGTYIEGELYVNHITAPVEIQQTEDTVLLGRFNCRCDRELPIGECNVGGTWYPVYAYGEGDKAEDLIFNYPHSHHFKNIPLRVMDSNEDVRVRAQCEGINWPSPVAAQPQAHEKKYVLTRDQGGGSTPTGDPDSGSGGDRCAVKIKEDNCPDLSETPETEEGNLCDVIEDYIDPNSSSDTPGRVADAEGGGGGIPDETGMRDSALERLAANRRNPPAGGFNSGTMRGDDDEFLA